MGSHEDCLTLNVTAPDNSGPGLPVLFFVHGGGPAGSAATPVYDGAAAGSARLCVRLGELPHRRARSAGPLPTLDAGDRHREHAAPTGSTASTPTASMRTGSATGPSVPTPGSTTPITGAASAIRTLRSDSNIGRIRPAIRARGTRSAAVGHQPWASPGNVPPIPTRPAATINRCACSRLIPRRTRKTRRAFRSA